MTSCQQARILTFGTRTLAVVATGVLSWFVAQPIAQHFDYALSDPMQIGVGVVAALIALFVSKRALDFTEDCMNVPDALARAAHTPERNCRKKSCQFHVDGDAAAKVTKPDAGSGEQAPSPPCASNPVTVCDHPSIKVAVQNEQSGTIVTVTISGVSAAKFKDKQSGLRKKIEGIGGIKWENPKNLGDNSRQMVGRISDSAGREAIITRLQELARSL